MNKYTNVFEQAEKHKKEKNMKLICYVRENDEVPFLEYMAKYELGAFDKPNKYGNKVKGKEINKMIQEALDIFEADKDDYLKNRKSVPIPFDL